MNNISAQSRVYIDSNIFIYFIEGVPDFYDQVSDFFELLATVGASIFTNEITIAECIYKPSANNDTIAVAAFKKLFYAKNEVQLIQLNGELSTSAARHGGTLGLKLMDSIHYLSALEAGCDYFITSDKAFRSCPEMTVIHIHKEGHPIA